MTCLVSIYILPNNWVLCCFCALNSKSIFSKITFGKTFAHILHDINCNTHHLILCVKKNNFWWFEVIFKLKILIFYMWTKCQKRPGLQVVIAFLNLIWTKFMKARGNLVWARTSSYLTFLAVPLIPIYGAG